MKKIKPKMQYDSRGAILVLSLLMLSVMLSIAFAILGIFIPKLKIAADPLRSVVALYAADSATEWCLIGQRYNTVVGNTTVEGSEDSNDSNTIEGARFTSLGTAGTAIAGVVYVNDIDTVPANRLFKMGLYADNGVALPGSRPAGLIAATATGTLSPNSWNIAPITAPIAANTVYWLAYTTNGRSAGVNNFRLRLNGGYAGWHNLPWSGGTVTMPSPFGAFDTDPGAVPTDYPSMFIAYSTRPYNLLPKPLSNGANWEVYNGNVATPICLSAESLDYRIVGTYSGISRSFEIFTAP